MDAVGPTQAQGFWIAKPSGRVFLANHEAKCDPISKQVQEVPKALLSHTSVSRTPHYIIVLLPLHTVGDGHCRPFPSGHGSEEVPSGGH
ncbi:UNVERIFIED_CONTAM: hypothetical protein Sradi_7126900 [Sesamum radiatum]|uniref:Uncharacterized protein n=1 Tax=Sesamum radiatum TaxID=300843 RepID=A0AAW2IYS7_SESRA